MNNAYLPIRARALVLFRDNFLLPFCVFFYTELHVFMHTKSLSLESLVWYETFQTNLIRLLVKRNRRCWMSLKLARIGGYYRRPVGIHWPMRLSFMFRDVHRYGTVQIARRLRREISTWLRTNFELSCRFGNWIYVNEIMYQWSQIATFLSVTVTTDQNLRLHQLYTTTSKLVQFKYLFPTF